jgi:hypothetical protein
MRTVFAVGFLALSLVACGEEGAEPDAGVDECEALMALPIDDAHERCTYDGDATCSPVRDRDGQLGCVGIDVDDEGVASCAWRICETFPEAARAIDVLSDDQIEEVAKEICPPTWQAETNFRDNECKRLCNKDIVGWMCPDATFDECVAECVGAVEPATHVMVSYCPEID